MRLTKSLAISAIALGLIGASSGAIAQGFVIRPGPYPHYRAYPAPQAYPVYSCHPLYGCPHLREAARPAREEIDERIIERRRVIEYER